MGFVVVNHTTNFQTQFPYSVIGWAASKRLRVTYTNRDYWGGWKLDLVRN